MQNKPKAVMCWSGGKDSAMALHLAQQDYEVLGLLTTLNSQFKRISMHGVREELLDAQATAIQLPQYKVWVGEGTNAEYEAQMETALLHFKKQGVTHVIFGDIFLEDLRAYRENNLKQVDLIAVFPLWQRNTHELIQTFINNDFKTLTCCINDGYLGQEWVGKTINNDFVKALPNTVDPCGENGEYHTFCYDGPIYKKPVQFTLGEIVYKPLMLHTTTTDTSKRDVDEKAQSDSKKTASYECISKVNTLGFWFIDLLPA